MTARTPARLFLPPAGTVPAGPSTIFAATPLDKSFGVFGPAHS
ncbi:hypothetical protein [Rhodobium gokarnense]|uniref:Uncharacterized protein n=1 Tax=Rhodobium gokarnense TaxID=364296 RepID=A0ABT3HF21_9HYPH|nr:hypothetical protein [Rhodobium gokarnense]MCW2308939.1 hypothetical protein [Rhodobium gokarnense]